MPVADSKGHLVGMPFVSFPACKHAGGIRSMGSPLPQGCGKGNGGHGDAPLKKGELFFKIALFKGNALPLRGKGFILHLFGYQFRFLIFLMNLKVIWQNL